MQHTHLTSAEVSTLLIYIQWKSIVSSRQSNRFAMVGVCFLNGEHLILELNLIWWKAPLQMHREGNFEYSISECLSRGPVDACSMRMAQKDEADMERGYSEGYWDIVGSCWRKGGGAVQHFSQASLQHEANMFIYSSLNQRSTVGISLKHNTKGGTDSKKRHDHIPVKAQHWDYVIQKRNVKTSLFLKGVFDVTSIQIWNTILIRRNAPPLLGLNVEGEEKSWE